MGKSKEAQQRDTDARRKKRHAEKAKKKVDELLDQKGTACAECRKHIAARIENAKYRKGLEDHIQELDRQMEERDLRWSEIERMQATTGCEVAPLREKLKEAEYQLKVQEKNHEVEVLELKAEHAQEISNWQQRCLMAMQHTGQIPKPAKEENIFVDPSDSPSRSPKKKKKKKGGGWGGDRRSAGARKKQAEQKKQQQRA